MIALDAAAGDKRARGATFLPSRNSCRREFWRDALFDQQKALVKDRFKLSNTQFSRALDVIQTNREMKAILGVESDLLHLADDEIVRIAEQWRRIHTVERHKDEGDTLVGLDYFAIARLEKMKAQMSTMSEVIGAIEKKITGDKLAELEAMFTWLETGYFPNCISRVSNGREKNTRRQTIPQLKSII